MKATFVRRFGTFSGVGEIEAVAVDDELGYVYYADEGTGIHKWPADPDAPERIASCALFGTTGYQQDREGIGIYALPDGTRLHRRRRSDSRREHLSRVQARRRTGPAARSHRTVLLSFTGGADGDRRTRCDVGAARPRVSWRRCIVAMNSAGRNFLLFRWNDLRPLLRTGVIERRASFSVCS